jgi:hypothetical protein
MLNLNDLQYKLAIAAGSAVVIIAVTSLRFCSAITLPGKPPMPVKIGTAGQLMKASNESASVWLDYLQKDAKAAGISAPTIADMSKAWQFQIGSKELGLDAPAQALAGVQVSLTRVKLPADNVAVQVFNASDHPLAYRIAAESSTSSYVCGSVKHGPHNAIVVAAGKTETVSVCPYRPGAEVTVVVETARVPELGIYYLQQLPATLLGIDERRAKQHSNGVTIPSGCSTIPSTGVRGGLENGKIAWRDLIDFYSRHRCQTYDFPLSYRALTKDGERTLPGADATR